jgi:hypothetical protein
MKVTVFPNFLATFDDVLVPLQRVGALHQRVESEVDFPLSGRGDLVVLCLDLQADGLHHAHHLVADVVEGIGGGDGEVPFLVTRLVTEVGSLLPAGVPGSLLGIDVEVPVIGCRGEPDVVEDEELGFRTEVRSVGDPDGFHVRLGLPGDVPRIARVGLLGDRIDDVADG